MDAIDYQIIRQLFDDYLRMYSSRDDRLTACFSENFSGFTGGGDFLVKNREEWVSITLQDFAQVQDPLRIELKDLAIQSLSETIAVTTGFFSIHLPIKDHILSRETARLVLIFRKESADWKITHSSISIPYYLVREGEVYPMKELVDRNQYLEKLVDERTTQLSEANVKLQQTNEELARLIAELQQTDETLRERETHYRLLTENASDVVWKVDSEYRFTYISPADERLRGYRADEVIGRQVFEWFDEEGISTIKKLARQREEAEQHGIRSGVATFEARHRCKDGRWIWGEVSATPERNADGTINGFYGITREITERKEHEKELLKMEKLESLGALAGGIAHDFNNILTGIMGNISFAQMFLDDNHKASKPLAEAERASVRAGELAHQLLTFARGGEPVKKLVSLNQLVNETVTFVLRGSNVKGCIEIPDSIHAVEADEGQMNQVFHNIIINATQAMPDGGTLTVTARNETLPEGNPINLPGGRYVRLAFSDQGNGIPDENLNRIFDPYFTTKASGKGLGLASAHSIVTRHGGHIGVSSETGNGTTFTIHLPSTGETYSPEQTDPTSQTDARHPGGAILVMDDEMVIREMTSELLNYLGYTATTCEDGTEAIAHYKAAVDSGLPYSAVIMDLTIPGGMGGKDAAQQILTIDPKACMIVSSGYSDDPIMSDYRPYGFSGAITKPYKMAEFGSMLSSILSKRQTGR
ncbi:MAG: PAS domain S-box protein [Deltaproteobacteria bacterium]|nr:PAS domain S-box protein [Deltaproteobacteria bacterium]TLN04318.1 MAG: PAS domain S-box protein [bacterium]